MFTGDRSGDFLFAALHRTGYANQPTSTAVDDGLELSGAYVSAVVRCAPPDNKPTPRERSACLPFLARELKLLTELRVLIALGGFAWDGILRAGDSLGFVPDAKPASFAHLAHIRLGPFDVLGSYHPSQQNTFTGRLTPPMLDEVLVRARELADGL